MATQENSRIKRVLKSYQSSAMRGLHGPGSYITTESSEVKQQKSEITVCNNNTSGSNIIIHGHKKLLQRQALLGLKSSAGSTPDDDISAFKAGYHHHHQNSYSSTNTTDSYAKGGGLYYSAAKGEADLKYHCSSVVANTSSDAKCDNKNSDATTVVEGNSCKLVSDVDNKCSVSSSNKSATVVVDSCSSYPTSKCHSGNDHDKWLLENKKQDNAVLQQHKDAATVSSGGGQLLLQQQQQQQLCRHTSPTPLPAVPPTVAPFGGWAQVGAFTPPSPHSPCSSYSPPHVVHPPPFPLVMGHADEYGVLGEAPLEGQNVACFSIGGEPRLCFAQVLYTSLRDISMPQINAECQSLHIYLSLCFSRQLQSLKEAGVLPQTAKFSGLITYSDAHRLTHALLHTNAPPSDPPKIVTLPYNTITHHFLHNSKYGLTLPLNTHSNNQLTPNIIVSHRCFGKCRGFVYLSLYVHPEAKCIQCCECRSFYSVTQFVCHAHRSLETRICHWGFDPANWRVYLQLASDQPLQPAPAPGAIAVLPETYLEQFKNKFHPAAPAAKHKQIHDGGQDELSTSDKFVASCDASPRASPLLLCQEEGSTGSVLLSAPDEGRLASLSMLSKDASILASPPASFVRESMPAPLPLNLRNKGPPQLVDPESVVPLSQYQNYKHCQPNISLVPPPHHNRIKESADRDHVTLFDNSNNKHVAEKDLSISFKVDSPGLSSAEKTVVAASSPNSGKGYTISLCPSDKLVDPTKLAITTPRDYSSSSREAKCYVVSDAKEYTLADAKGYPVVNAPKGCSVIRLNDLRKMITLDQTSVPKDLQIIKLDSSVHGLKNVHVLNRDEDSLLPSKELKIIKLGSGGSSEYVRSIKQDSSSCANSPVYLTRNTRESSEDFGHVVIKEELADESEQQMDNFNNSNKYLRERRSSLDNTSPLSSRRQAWYDNKSDKNKPCCSGNSETSVSSYRRSCSAADTVVSYRNTISYQALPLNISRELCKQESSSTDPCIDRYSKDHQYVKLMDRRNNNSGSYGGSGDGREVHLTASPTTHRTSIKDCCYVKSVTKSGGRDDGSQLFKRAHSGDSGSTCTSLCSDIKVETVSFNEYQAQDGEEHYSKIRRYNVAYDAASSAADGRTEARQLLCLETSGRRSSFSTAIKDEPFITEEVIMASRDELSEAESILQSLTDRRAASRVTALLYRLAGLPAGNSGSSHNTTGSSTPTKNPRSSNNNNTAPVYSGDDANNNKQQNNTNKSNAVVTEGRSGAADNERSKEETTSMKDDCASNDTLTGDNTTKAINSSNSSTNQNKKNTEKQGSYSTKSPDNAERIVSIGSAPDGKADDRRSVATDDGSNSCMHIDSAIDDDIGGDNSNEIVTNTGIKRQRAEEESGDERLALEVKVRRLEDQLEMLQAELSCYKSVKTEPRDETPNKDHAKGSQNKHQKQNRQQAEPQKKNKPQTVEQKQQEEQNQSPHRPSQDKGHHRVTSKEERRRDKTSNVQQSSAGQQSSSDSRSSSTSVNSPDSQDGMSKKILLNNRRQQQHDDSADTERELEESSNVSGSYSSRRKSSSSYTSSTDNVAEKIYVKEVCQKRVLEKGNATANNSGQGSSLLEKRTESKMESGKVQKYDDREHGEKNREVNEFKKP